MDYYGFCNSEHESNYIVPVLASVLNQLIARNDKMPINPEGMTRFHAFKPPSITVQNYLNRVVKYVACSTECFIMALIYIDRIIQRNTYFIITSLNVHRLLITSVMLAMKFFEDSYYTNAYYAKVGGVSCSEMNLLELDFLFLIDFSLNVSPELFNRYRAELVKHAFNYCACPCGVDPVTMSLPLQNTNGMPDWNNNITHYPQYASTGMAKAQFVPSPPINQFDQHQQRLTVMASQNHSHPQNKYQNKNKNNSTTPATAAYYQPLQIPVQQQQQQQQQVLSQQVVQQHYPSHYPSSQPQSAPIANPQFQIKLPMQTGKQVHGQQVQMTPQSKMPQQLHDNYNSIEVNHNLANITNIMATPNNNQNSSNNQNEYSQFDVINACEAIVKDEVTRMRLPHDIIPRASQLFFKEVMKYRSFSPYIMCNIMQRVCESLEKENILLPRANLVARAWYAEAYIKAV